ncbi:hypothetical protein WJX77_006308 [Trebouxia sp. C0004]
MFSYLSKKIAIPNNAKLKCIAWNGEQGWIACGSEQGMLKVLKLEDPKAVADASPAGGQGLNANQTLQGHADSVVVAAWNEQHNKLTTSDSNGLIIVWILHKGLWFEEMINNRNKSVVTDMRWAADGSKICIIYEDGAVIVGGVDGNRIWGKELDLQLTLLDWSPDGRRLLFCTTAGDCHIIDAGGNSVSKVPLHCKDAFTGQAEIIGLEWYKGQEGYSEPGCPVLAICLRTGQLQLMKDELDDTCLVLKTGMQASNIKWNSNGSVLAVSGVMGNTGPGAALLQFYSYSGQHLRTLRVPGTGIKALAWEKGGLRIALAVDSFVYFANVQPNYHWAYFAGTVVYAFSKPDRAEACVVFWDVQTHETYAKYVRRLITVKAAGQHCILVTRGEETGQCNIILCDAIGTPVDSSATMVEPLCLTMTSTHVVAASGDTVFVWLYSSASGTGNANVVGGAKLAQAEATFKMDAAAATLSPRGSEGTSNPITAIAAVPHMLLVGRSSGEVHCYTLPDLVPAGKHTLRCRPQALALNCNSTRMSVIDLHGVLSFYDFHVPPQQPGAQGSGVPTSGEHLAVERKDVWDMLWSEDSPDLFAILEKGRMYIFRGLDPEEPVQSAARLCCFKDLEVTAVMLDDIMKAGTEPEKHQVLQFETRSLRDTRQLLNTVSIADTMQFIEQNPHPRLWRALAEHALKARNYDTAEKSFVRCADYQGIQVVKQLRRMDTALKQDAEIALYLKQFDEAESLYRHMDRPDLAIDMRMRLGDWSAAEKLLKASGSGNDTLMVTIWNKIGDHHADRHKWHKAAAYYAQAKNSDALADALYRLEDFEGLEQLTAALPDGSPLLLQMGEQFQSVGLCQQAAAAYIKGGEVKRAVDCCVLLSQWDQAVTLAQEYSIPQIQTLLFKYAAMLLEQQRTMEAVQLYRKAHFHKEAAQLLLQLAKSEAARRAPPVRIKKLYLLAALEVDQLKARMLNIGEQPGTGSPGKAGGASTGTAAAAHTLAGLVELEAAGGAGLGAGAAVSAWHGAQAYHFWLLAHRQLYAGNTDAAMRTALHLRKYDDVLDPQDVYSLLGLTAFYNGFFGQCSKAFTRLESLTNIDEAKRESFADLAMSIFMKDPPNDPKSLYETREQGSIKLASLGMTSKPKASKREVCVASGKLIKGMSTAVCCQTCKQYTSYAEREDMDICALCHTQLPLGSSTSLLTNLSYLDTDMK